MTGPEEKWQQHLRGRRPQQQRWPNLRGFKFERVLENDELPWLLRCFPNLEDLEVKWNYQYAVFSVPQSVQMVNTSETYNILDPSTWLDIDTILLETTRQQPLKLKRFHLKLSRSADPLLPVLLPYLPSLTELIIPRLSVDTAHALAIHCPGLQIFRTDPSQPQASRFSDNRESSLNIASILLANCRNLRVFEGSTHMIEIESLRGQDPWRCSEKLEVLRVQFGGFVKLDEDEQLMLETESLEFQEFIFTDRDDHNDNGDNDDMSNKDEKTKKENEKMAALREKYDLSKSQHTLFFTTLARLRNLRILDLGPDSETVLYNPRPSPSYTNNFTDNPQPPVGQEEDTNHHVIIVPSTPSLTLEYGLSHLHTLQNLRVLNFEAVDHRLEKKDVIWMATHLKGLRNVFGLHFALPKSTDFVRSYRAELDYRRIMLRMVFSMQRASVHHDDQRL
ncbi:hypothetical protein BG015_002120 [Linnemannia schmuckeri]|uniref:F-box domain-containing protein n=1 Tax=Linnemannia schmuckeri TaxID=64567 RepID=A0A9P5RSB9_9FUNG|nr:hypothetical protein BG015_002120 [Linnemannia schmuckeri]